MKDSLLYSFLDGRSIFCVHFLEAQKLIADMFLKEKPAKTFFIRQALLSSTVLISLIKQGEHFGFYFTSKEPEFNFRLEVRSNGDTRCALDKEITNNKNLNGLLRIVKHQPYQNDSYSSHILIEDLDYIGLINKALKESFQFESRVLIEESSDQSFLISKLPLSRSEILEGDVPDIDTWVTNNKNLLQSIAKKALTGSNAIIQEFSNIGFKLWQTKGVRLFCDCSLERLLEILAPIYKADKVELFGDKDEIQVDCEYCYKCYTIKPSLF